MKPARTTAIPEAALAQHTAVIGKTGSGKTSTEKLAIEQVVNADFRVCVLDTIKSDWWGITSSADGREPGLPFRILGGPRGHVPLHSSAGAAIGRLVAEGKLPLSIVDMADFMPGGIQQFFCDFAAALMRHMRGVLYLVIEEAHEIAPKERAGFGAENMAIHWAKKLATAGRSKGIRLIVATQRVQSLHNAVLGSCETLIVHRLAAPADQEPIQKWMKANADKATVEQVMGSLSSLPTGTGWLLSGEARLFEQVAFPKFATFDNTKTPESDDDEGEEFHVTTAPVDPDELKAIIGDALKDAEAHDPKALRAEVARLKADVERLSKGVPAPAADRSAADRAYKDGYDTGRQHGTASGASNAVTAISRLLPEIQSSIANARDAAEGAARLFSSFLSFMETQAIAARQATSAPPAIRSTSAAASAPSQAPRPRPPGEASAPKIGAGERKLLTAIAQAGRAGVTREALTVLVGYKRSSRNTYLQRLTSGGLIGNDGDRLVASDAGLAVLGDDYEPLPTGDALRRHWQAQLPEGERKVFDVICEEYPRGLQRGDLHDLTGYKRSSANTYVQRLAARGLIETRGGDLRASEALFG